MRHYRIVKKTTFVLSAIAVLAAVFNAVLLAVSTLNFLPIGESSVVHAICDANTPPATFSLSKDDIARTISLSFTRNDLANKIGFTAEVKASNPADPFSFANPNPTIATITGESNDGYSNSFTPDPATLIIPPGQTGLTQVTVIVTYQNLTDPSCSYNPQPSQIQQVDFTGTGSGPVSLHGSIDIQAEPSSINLKNADGTDNPNPATNITFTLTDHNNEVFHLWITNCDGNYDDVPGFGSATRIQEDPYTRSFDWTVEDKSCTYHNVRIKTFTPDGSTLTGSQEITIDIENSGGATPGGGGSNGSDTLETPSRPIRFLQILPGGSIILPRHFRGAGDVIQAIISILIYLIGAFAFISLVIGGIQYITSGGDPAKAEKAKKTLIYSVIGIIVAVWAYVIVGIAARFWAGPN